MQIELEAEAPATAADPFGDMAPWQTMLDRYAVLFTDMVEGSSVGFVPRSGSGIQPGKHVAGLVEAAGDVPMMKWINDGSGMTAGLMRYSGFQEARVDLLFVADDEALEAMRASLGADTLSLIKRLIRQGHIMFFVLRTKFELQDAGYEEFLDTLGLAFLGACR
ncbi:hypothetical protein GPA22_08400 [Aromatoleum toluvorans]|uniref:Uncharacterized protein n=1 Tax=Aromatoleum toluvorans TaxID=92002 RepID=A0ABX1PX38_9RHOO|nr:hypothetical protein [Aromatoleum toluvorans]NMG43750.1 hypothetical protein [Aromatoleum toluvorans]